MTGEYIPILAAVVIAVVAFLWPGVGGAFFLSGTVVYYSTLEVLGIEASGQITGVVFSLVAVASIARSLRESSSVFVWPTDAALVLFLGFVGLWYWRWWLQPPPPMVFEFSERATLYMFVFGVLSFLVGLSISNMERLQSLLVATAWQGVISAVIVAAHWAVGTDYGEAGSLRWVPIPALSVIWLAFDLGIGLLAFLAMRSIAPSRGKTSAFLSWPLAALVLAEVIKVGERGPLAFLILAVLVSFAIRYGTTRGYRRWQLIGAAAAVAVLAGLVMFSEESRATQLEGYRVVGAENTDRIDLLRGAFQFWLEAPFLGWGGALTGRPYLGGQAWQYSHVWLIDSLVETGLIGALAHWALLILALYALVRRWRAGGEARIGVTAIVGLLFYVFAENQVSGHVSLAKQLWFMLGVACAPWRITPGEGT